MDRLQKVILVAIVSTSALTWIVSSLQQDSMMRAMEFGSMALNPITLSLFTTIWTIGMAAMMFPAISPMVLLYNRLISKTNPNQSTATVIESRNDSAPFSPSKTLKTILFIGSYLVVWALTGIALFIGWSMLLESIMAISPSPTNWNMDVIYGSILIISGAYQFSPLKSKCLGYCESPLSFFMRRWKEGTFGAVKMGLYHGLYCLGCCWPYFFLMVALGWMNLLWMGLFAAIIFGEKIWNRGIWVARAAGIGLAIVGLLVIAGMIPSLFPPMSSAATQAGNSSSSMATAEGNSGFIENSLGSVSQLPSHLIIAFCLIKVYNLQ